VVDTARAWLRGERRFEVGDGELRAPVEKGQATETVMGRRVLGLLGQHAGVQPPRLFRPVEP
jgi:hypothetical protein